MRTIKAVIGANYGDESKGNITAYLAKQDPTAIVVRYCGGANAGHTVEIDGKRHVFHHFGSGTLTGNPTVLEYDFIVNPLLFCKELDELSKIGFWSPVVGINSSCRVTTPFDMMINQEIEMQRGALRHGSCGVGIFETRKRCEDSNYETRWYDLIQRNYSKLSDQLRRIAKEWVPYRLHLLRIDPSGSFKKRMEECELWIEKFICAAREMTSMIKRGAIQSADESNYIFEGSQGLLLHEKHEYFPHVTPARTGIEIPSAFAKTLSVDRVEAFYVTRTYATRHGAGPFPEEDRTISHVDLTNAPNPWQGSMRFGRLNMESMADEIRRDVEKSQVPVDAKLAITWMDILAGEQESYKFIVNLMRKTHLPVELLSYGPDVGNVQELSEVISV